MAAGPTYEPIATTTLGTSTGIVYFGASNTLTQAYTDLVLVVSAAISAATYDITAIRVNSVTTNYSKTYFQADGSSATSGRGTAEISLRGGYLPGTNYSNQFSSDVYHFSNYTSAANNKMVLMRANFVNSPASFSTQTQASLIPTTSAITQISVQTANGANFVAGSSFTLYGIAAA